MNMYNESLITVRDRSYLGIALAPYPEAGVPNTIDAFIYICVFLANIAKYCKTVLTVSSVLVLV